MVNDFIGFDLNLNSSSIVGMELGIPRIAIRSIGCLPVSNLDIIISRKIRALQIIGNMGKDVGVRIVLAKISSGSSKDGTLGTSGGLSCTGFDSRIVLGNGVSSAIGFCRLQVRLANGIF